MVSGYMRDAGAGLPGVNVKNLRTHQGTSTDLDGRYEIRALTGDTLSFSFIGYVETYGLVTDIGVIPLSKRNPKATTESSVTKWWDKIQQGRYGADSISGVPRVFFQTSEEGVPEGVATLEDDSPTYTVRGGNLSASELWLIRPRMGKRYVIRRLPDQDRFWGVEYATGFGMGWATQRPALQSTFAQGRPLNGMPTWQGPQTGEIYSWGPRIDLLTYDGIPTPYNEQGGLILATDPDTETPQTTDPYAALQATLQYYQALRLQIPLGGWNRLHLQARQNQHRGLWPGEGTQGHGFSASLPKSWGNDLQIEARTEFEQIEGQLTPQGNHHAMLWSSLLRTPATFDNAAGLEGREALANPMVYTAADGTIRSHAPGQADNPFGLLATLPDEEYRRKWASNAAVVWNPTYEINLGVQGNHLAQLHQRTWGMAPGYGGWEGGRISERTVRTQQAKVRAFGQVNAEIFGFYYGPFLQLTVDYQWDYLEQRLQRTDAFGLETAEGQVLWTGQADRTESIAETPQRSVHLATGKLEIAQPWQYVYGHTSATYYTSNTLPTAGEWMGNVWAQADFEEMMWIPGTERLQVTGGWEYTLEEAPILLNHWAYASTGLSVADYHQAYDVGEVVAPSGLLPQYQQSWLAELRYSSDRWEAWLGDYSTHLDVTVRYQRDNYRQWIAPAWTGTAYELMNTAAVREDRWRAQSTVGWRYGNKRRKNLSLELTWERYRNQVRSIASPSEVVPIAGFQEAQTVLTPDHPVGVLYGTAYARDEAGRMVIGTEGFPLVADELQVIGNPIPDWTGTLRLLWAIKDQWSFSTTLRRVQGGEIWNGTQALLDYWGRSQTTADLRQTAGYVFPGVTEAGQVNQVPVNFAGADAPVSENRWVRYGPGGVAEAYVQDASHWRWQELAVRYRYQDFPEGKPVQALEISVVGTNLWQPTEYAGVDPNQSLLGYAAGLGLDLFNMPSTRQFTAHLTLTF